MHSTSGVLPSYYSNGCSSAGCSSNKIDQTSDAFKACSEKGWRLPKKEDWDRLVKEFEHKEHATGVSLTLKGREDFFKQFDIAGRVPIFSSSTIINSPFKQAFAFHPYWIADEIIAGIKAGVYFSNKETFSGERRVDQNKVKCIRSSVPVS